MGKLCRAQGAGLGFAVLLLACTCVGTDNPVAALARLLFVSSHAGLLGSGPVCGDEDARLAAFVGLGIGDSFFWRDYFTSTVRRVG